MRSDNRPKEKTAEQALSTLQWLCSKMERCESDIRRSLSRWHVPEQQWTEIIEKLRRDKFVDNQRYAEMYTRDKATISSWGVAKITNGLRAKGIDAQTIERAIAGNVSPEEMRHKLDDFIRKRIEKERSKSKNEYDLRCRTFRAAASRGFDFEQINTILNRYLRDDD